MRKYKVLNPWFAANIGDILRSTEKGHLIDKHGAVIIYGHTTRKCLDDGWIEEIKEPTRWRAKEGDYFFTLDVDLNPDASIEMRRSYEGDLYELGNYFRSRETANLVSEAQKLFFEWLHTPKNNQEEKPEQLDKLQKAIRVARRAVLKDDQSAS